MNQPMNDIMNMLLALTYQFFRLFPKQR